MSILLHRCPDQHQRWVSDSVINLPTNSQSINICVVGIEFFGDEEKECSQSGSVSISVLQQVYISTLGNSRWVPFICKKLLEITIDDIVSSNMSMRFNKKGRGLEGSLFTNKRFSKEPSVDIPHNVNKVSMIIKCHGCIKSILLKYAYY